MQRRRVSAVDSQRLVERARKAIRYVQTVVLPTTEQRIEQSRELLSRSTGRELESRQRVDDEDAAGAS